MARCAGCWSGGMEAAAAVREMLASEVNRPRRGVMASAISEPRESMSRLVSKLAYRAMDKRVMTKLDESISGRIQKGQLCVSYSSSLCTHLASLGERRQRPTGWWAGAGRELRRSLSVGRHCDVVVLWWCGGSW